MHGQGIAFGHVGPCQELHRAATKRHGQTKQEHIPVWDSSLWSLADILCFCSGEGSLALKHAGKGH